MNMKGIFVNRIAIHKFLVNNNLIPDKNCNKEWIVYEKIQIDSDKTNISHTTHRNVTLLFVEIPLFETRVL